MEVKDEGGPAYPCKTYTQGGYPSGESMGMSLRDWFAGNAPPMPESWYAVPFIGEPPKDSIFPYDGPSKTPAEFIEMELALRRESLEWEARAIAAWRFSYADAMLAVRATP